MISEYAFLILKKRNESDGKVGVLLYVSGA